MKNLTRIRYYSANPWNISTAPAYNLKINKVVDNKLQDKVYQLMDCEDFYADINSLLEDFSINHNYEWQAGFNGRSGGYLVLYKGGKKTAYYKKEDFNKNNGYDSRIYISDNYGWMNYKEAKKANLVDRVITTSIFTYPSKHIEDEDVPKEVLRDFHNLAMDIVKDTEYKAKNYKVKEEEYSIIKTRKVLVS